MPSLFCFLSDKIAACCRNADEHITQHSYMTRWFNALRLKSTEKRCHLDLTLTNNAGQDFKYLPTKGSQF